MPRIGAGGVHGIGAAQGGGPLGPAVAPALSSSPIGGEEGEPDSVTDSVTGSVSASVSESVTGSDNVLRRKDLRPPFVRFASFAIADAR
jgi:hypothetical protein